MSRMTTRLKRVIDVTVAGLGLLLVSPMIALIAVAVRLALGSPVLFRQRRPGLGGRPFTLLKFRTMTDARDLASALLPDVERLTRFGRFLRSTSLDELPELINVLCGEMSLVGPRPLLMQYREHYTPEEARRHEVRPGITGWAQVNGRNALDWDQKLSADVWYVDHASLALDLRIITITIWRIISREGISHGAEATMKEFEGSQPCPSHETDRAAG